MQVHRYPIRNSFPAIIGGCLLAAAISNQAIAQSGKVPPWLADAPGEFVRLIDRGNVQIVVDDDRIQKAGKTALTVFQFEVDFDYKFRFQLLEYDNEAGVWRAKIIAWIEQPKVRLDHKICIQSTFITASPWESKLLRHEFDHVAISTDPRMLKIIKLSLQQRREWVGTWEQAAAPTEQDIRKSILEKLTAEVKTLEQLVESQYVYLDSESTQGLSAINNRKDFFMNLYTVAGIDRCKYELRPAMREYVKEKLSNRASQKEVEGHYLFLTP